MYSIGILKYHILMFKVCGLWPNERSSWLYDCWTFIFIVFVAIGFPLSQLVCVLFVDSIDSMVENLILSSTVVTASIKGINILIQKRKLVELCNIFNAMDDNVAINKQKYREIFDPIFKSGKRISMMFVCAYSTAWLILVLQVIFSRVENNVWSSTYLYPSDYLHKPSIYVGGLFYQAISNLFLCLFDAAFDTCAVILLNLLVGHINVLKIQLQEFDSDKLKQYQSLIRFCENYKDVVRYKHR